MSTLIVDFPPHQRVSYAGVRSEKKKTVRFNPVIAIQYYHGPSASDARKLFYSNDEYTEMRDARARDVRDVNRQYRAIASGGLPPSAELEFTGLEGVLTSELVTKRLVRVNRVCRAVLMEQHMQDKSGECDPDMIAAASRHYSKNSTLRAARIAFCTAQDV